MLTHLRSSTICRRQVVCLCADSVWLSWQVLAIVPKHNLAVCDFTVAGAAVPVRELEQLWTQFVTQFAASAWLRFNAPGCTVFNGPLQACRIRPVGDTAW